MFEDGVKKLLLLYLLALPLPDKATEPQAAPPVQDEAPPLTAEPGVAELGAAIFADRATGHCVLCHRLDSLDAPFQGDLGPDLSRIGARLTPGQLRLRIMDASLLNPRTVMPPYYRTEGLHRVASGQVGKTFLTDEQIEHLVAFLAGLEGE